MRRALLVAGVLALAGCKRNSRPPALGELDYIDGDGYLTPQQVREHTESVIARMPEHG